jgi:hypothetical protein
VTTTGVLISSTAIKVAKITRSARKQPHVVLKVIALMDRFAKRIKSKEITVIKMKNASLITALKMNVESIIPFLLRKE